MTELIKKRGRPRKVDVEEYEEEQKPKKSRNEYEKREKDLFLEIKERIISKGYHIVHSVYGMMIVSHPVKVKVPFIPPTQSFAGERDNEKTITVISVIVWHEDQHYLTQIFPEGSIYAWCWKNGSDIVKINSREDVLKRWGNL